MKDCTVEYSAATQKLVETSLSFAVPFALLRTAAGHVRSFGSKSKVSGVFRGGVPRLGGLRRFAPGR